MAKAKEEQPKAHIVSYKASPTMAAFHESNAFVKGIMGPIGCVAPETLVLTEFGAIPIWRINRPMRVVSWNEKRLQFQLSWCGSAFPKGTDFLNRVTTRQGEFAANEYHRVLAAHNAYRPVGSLYPGQSLRQCSDVQALIRSAHALEESHEGDRSSIGIAVDSLDRYAASARQYGQRLLREEGIDLEFLQQQDGAQTSTYRLGLSAFERMGDLAARLQERIRQGLSACHTQIGDFLCPDAPPPFFVGGLGDVVFFAHTGEQAPAQRQSHLSFVGRQPAPPYAACSNSIHEASNITSSSEGVILKIEHEKVKRSYWDMQVLDTNNYVTIDGTIHHNSGKSVACCFELFLRAQKSIPDINGLRRRRSIIVRNTLPQLETTTIKTWVEWFPEHKFGRITRKPPYTQMIKVGNLEWEVIFLALDQPDDVKKLLSLECTDIWFNEAREIHKSILDAATGRVGRFPPQKDRPEEYEGEFPYYKGIIMDTNPPDDTHWFHNYEAEHEWFSDDLCNNIFMETGFKPSKPEKVPDKYRWDFFLQPSGLSAEAENIENLPSNYYGSMLSGKTKEWIQVYVHGRYGFIQDGKSVYLSSWNDDLHVAKTDIQVDQRLTLVIGLDFGLTPCAIFCQKLPSGAWRIIDELITEDCGITRFGQILSSEIAQKYNGMNITIYGDPAGTVRDQDERTAFSILGAMGIIVREAPSNEIFARKEAVETVLNRMIGGAPSLQLSPKCVTLRKGFNGGYKFKRLSVGGAEFRYDNTPMKNKYSHPHDALQYAMLGGGEFKNMTIGRNASHVHHVVQKTWNCFNTSGKPLTNQGFRNV